MSPTSALPALACLAVALATCEFIRRLGSARLPASRFVTIDGLRGYLAFFVFLHHSSIWYYYLKDGLWQLPPSRLYAHFGQTSVALFFMVTGFLFAHKLLHSRGTPIRWLDVYASISPGNGTAIPFGVHGHRLFPTRGALGPAWQDARLVALLDTEQA
ncbi:acyltransferase family protein [Pseudomonas aeruginosa]|uniref:acyltransferase family protein n=1 Tax=Pseudomonas aeruginosa TaxID=287 RepID=UPI000AC962F8|nr:acyltransferase family protein [Pseudomonas aeruginosa]MDC8989720.1 acyltransferase family protein [Pseudomonas aeruginosa]MDG3720758.1 acyltransferase [Pseudomonas aeruginosa]MDG3749797.1 acyltransferase [Pseudomonas aeruginosa]MDG3794169.1 acyltransferase [Pseudomonas aeruginosa]MDS9526652.1 acyltransferase family protein [Pseudomonas aeruginosa]